ncbi:MAG: hypothetical protein GQ535_08970 [Rhodobacteraceae bacterium]|nr:hypothetical protein [Paracoccaceae bacterium]
MGAFGYDSDPWDTTYYAVPAMYNLSPKLVLGGYYGQELWGGGGANYATYGLEAKFTPGFLDSRLTFEAFAGIYLNQLNDLDNKMIGLGVDYMVNDSINLGASYLRGAWTDFNDPVDQYDVLEIEGTYHMASGLYATVSYTNTIFQGSTGEEATFGIAIGYSFFGQGVTFDRRGYSAFYPGD